MRAVAGPYAAWSSWLEAFGRGEDLPNAHLVPVTDELGPHMQARVLHRLNEAFVARQQRWVEAFVRDRDAAPPTPFSLATNLVHARVRLRPLVALTRNELLPGNVRDALRDALAEAVRSSQRNLEDSVRRLPHDADVLLTTIRDNTLVSALREPVQTNENQTRPVGRGVIL